MDVGWNPGLSSNQNPESKRSEWDFNKSKKIIHVGNYKEEPSMSPLPPAGGGELMDEGWIPWWGSNQNNEEQDESDFNKSKIIINVEDDIEEPSMSKLPPARGGELMDEGWNPGWSPKQNPEQNEWDFTKSNLTINVEDYIEEPSMSTLPPAGGGELMDEGWNPGSSSNQNPEQNEWDFNKSKIPINVEDYIEEPSMSTLPPAGGGELMDKGWIPWWGSNQNNEEQNEWDFNKSKVTINVEDYIEESGMSTLPPAGGGELMDEGWIQWWSSNQNPEENGLDSAKNKTDVFDQDNIGGPGRTIPLPASAGGEELGDD